MFGAATQNGVGVGIGNIPTLTSLPYPTALYVAVLNLFSSGTPGAFYDANDWGTSGTNGVGVLYQDAAGTTPVTAVEQPVGLVLDKSQNLALGAELVTNGDFSSGTGWSFAGGGVGQSISGGKLIYSNANNLGAYQSIVAAGNYYECTFTIDSITAGGVRFSLASSTKGVTRTAPGTYTERLFAYGATAFFQLESVGNTSCVIDNASCKKISGNHAYQSTSANRPTLTARYNLLTKTDQYDAADWIKDGLTITPDSVAAPSGFADAAYETATTGTHRVYESATTAATSNTYYTIAKPIGGRDWIYLRIRDNTANERKAWFNITTGATGTAETGLTSTIAAAGSGFYLCKVVIATAFAGAQSVVIGTASADGVESFAGDITKGVAIWRSDLRPTDQATGLIPTYQRVNTSTDYDTVGFPPLIKGNGSNQFLQTASIDFTGTNKMTVWAGLRKVSDSGTQIVCELSADATANNGAFDLVINGSGASDLFSSRGTSRDYALVSFTGSPRTSIYTGRASISAPIVSLSLNNGAASNSSAGSQGTGNYGSYPFYLLSRAGTSLFSSAGFNSLIVLGRAASSGEIAMAENWCNYKIKAY